MLEQKKWLFSVSLLALTLTGFNKPSGFLVERFVDPLPTPPTFKFRGKGHSHLTMRLKEFKLQLHRDLPPVEAFGYDGMSPGPTIEVEAGQSLTVDWKNELPTKHIFEAASGMDMSAGGPMPPDVRAVTHLHGAVVTQPSKTNVGRNNDGWPDAWTTAGQVQAAFYGNRQSSRTIWYHDHSNGTTGRNVAAGLAGMYLIRDSYERSLNLPKGKFEIPLIFQAQGLKNDGSRYYTNNLSNEFYGNLTSVNGKILPFLQVEPRKYRFRVVNATTARTLGMKLQEITNLNAKGPAMYQIGTDSGFLEKTAVLSDPLDSRSPELYLGSGERADVIIDFSKYAGRNFILTNDALTDPDGEIPDPQLMLFKIGTTLSEPDSSSLPLSLRPLKKLVEKDSSVTRRLIFVQTEVNGSPMFSIDGKLWNDPVSEKPVLGTTEIWELVNPSILAHPFHIHLVQFQILDRTPFDLAEYKLSGKVKFIGPPEPPPPSEAGWKDTVLADKRKMTRIIMKFAPFPGYYVYHCHILEHEDMGMMRPFEVVRPQ